MHDAYASITHHSDEIQANSPCTPASQLIHFIDMLRNFDDGLQPVTLFTILGINRVLNFSPTIDCV